MKNKILIFLILALIFIPITVSAISEPMPILFQKAGGGQYIYCNNPEFVEPRDLSTVENPNATYMMKCEKLKPDTYAVFFCFYNNTTFDLEADIEFFSETHAEIRIDSVAYISPIGYEYWDCIGAWADYLKMPIRTLNRYGQYVSFTGDTDVPAVFTLNGDSEWISKYIYNYGIIEPKLTFNMLVQFTVLSGEADVNFAALKSYGTVGDRRYHSTDALPGKYRRDTSIKGIDTTTLPVVEAELNIEIDEDTPNGDSLPVKIFNQYHNDGNVAPHWMTNINPSRDAYLYSKNVASTSDMLSFAFKDDTKLGFYGSNVPAKDRNNLYYFDIYHHDTTAYQDGMPWKREDHIPNAFTSETLNVNSLPNPEWEYNLGNFGVTNRYYFNIVNNDTEMRTVNYMLETSLSSNIVAVRDEDGRLLNPYTLTTQDAFALCKGINSAKKTDCMFSAEIPAKTSKRYIVDVILPTNCYGGILNSVVIDTKRHIAVQPFTPFPVFDKQYPFKGVYSNGNAYFGMINGEFFTLDKTWQKIEMSAGAKQLLSDNINSYQTIKTKDGYAARFAGWDGRGWNIVGIDVRNTIYFFDKNFNYTHKKEFATYIYDMLYADDALYVAADKVYRSSDMKNFGIAAGFTEFPMYNGTYMITRSGKDWTIKNVGAKDIKYSYESGDIPHEMMQSGELFYYRKSWKAYFTDTYSGNILSVSTDGVHWTDLYFPDVFLELLDVTYIDGKIYVDGRYQSFVLDYEPPKDDIKVVLNGEMLVFTVNPAIVENRTMVPLRFFFEKLGAKVTWLEETQQIKVELGEDSIIFRIGDREAQIGSVYKAMDVCAYFQDGKTMIPLRFLSENLGCKAEWDENFNIAFVTQTLSIPNYLNAAAEREGVNFSAVLQDALKERLGIR